MITDHLRGNHILASVYDGECDIAFELCNKNMITSDDIH